LQRISSQPAARPTVVCIGGNAQNGATMLSRALELTPGWLSIGEVGYIWDRGILENYPCGCGFAFADCSFWQEVGARAFGGWSRELGVEGRQLREGLMPKPRSIGHPAALPLLMWPDLASSYAARARRYAQLLDRLYDAAAAVSGADVIVDMMKWPSHVYTVAAFSGLPVEVVHLVRDARGMAYSGSKVVAKPTGTGTRRQRSAYQSAYRWVWVNTAFEVLAQRVPTTRVRYEDFVRDPAGEVLRITGEELPISGRRLPLGDTHIVAGNRSRFSSGIVELREDIEWRERLPERDRARITAIAAPSLLRYGYPLRGHDVSGSTALRKSSARSA
jgi:hypothetical protein